MKYKEHFSAQMRTQMTDVWKEVFNLFTDLRDEKYAYVDEKGYEWHNIKLDEYRFINIVKTLYEKLNTPNSRCLVKDFHDQLSPASISKHRFCLEKDNQILCYTDSRITEYERNIIFGGLYYVLYKQQESLKEPNVVEKVKQIACKNGIPFLHYFYYFEEALLGKHTISSQPAEKPVGRSVKEYDQLLEICTQLENYKLWIEDTMATQGQYFPDHVKQELHDLKKCLDVCQKSLPLGGLKPQACGATIVVPKGTSPVHIKDYIQKQFSQIYNQYFSALISSSSLPKTNSQKSFRNIIQNVDPDKLLSILHQHIDGKGGKDVGIVIGAALYKYHYLTRYPTEMEFSQEFTDITSGWRAIQNAFKEPAENKKDAFSADIMSIELKIPE